MTRFCTFAGFISLSTLLLSICSCGRLPLDTAHGLSYAQHASDPLTGYALTGDTHRVLDPSIMRQAGTYYLFSTDVLGSAHGGNLPVRCSTDKLAWSSCGNVFPDIPEWVLAKIPGVSGLWAPDISFFNGLYHLYYSASTLNSQRSVIGLATNVSLDPSSSSYRWVDRGEVLASTPGDDFNAIDPNIFVDSGGKVFLTYGSFWSGIKQLELDSGTGLPLPEAPRYNLAARSGVAHSPIEGASLVQHGNFYYLFVSVDFCCNADPATNNYKQAVGRSLSPHGPFADIDGTPMMEGGSTVLLEGNDSWIAPGGGTAFLDPGTGEISLVFHALNAAQHDTQYVWFKQLSWQNDWPFL